MIGVNRARIRSMTRSELERACLQLSQEWRRAGCPDEEEMPRWMLIRLLALREERERRGDQLSLF